MSVPVELIVFSSDQISINNLVLPVFFPTQAFAFKISYLKHTMCCVLKSRTKELLTMVGEEVFRYPRLPRLYNGRVFT